MVKGGLINTAQLVIRSPVHCELFKLSISIYKTKHVRLKLVLRVWDPLGCRCKGNATIHFLIKLSYFVLLFVHK